MSPLKLDHKGTHTDSTLASIMKARTRPYHIEPHPAKRRTFLVSFDNFSRTPANTSSLHMCAIFDPGSRAKPVTPPFLHIPISHLQFNNKSPLFIQDYQEATHTNQYLPIQPIPYPIALRNPQSYRPSPYT